MPLTASKLRENIYRILDQVIETGVPVEVRRKGRIVKIIAEEQPTRTERLRPRAYLREDPEKLVHCDWSQEWQP